MDQRLTAAARVLALIVSADGRVDRRALDAIGRLDGYAALGIDQADFGALATQMRESFGSGVCERSWLTAGDEAFVDHLLDAVADPQARLLIAQLGAAAIAAAEPVPLGARRVFDHAMARWRIGRERLTLRAEPLATEDR